MAAAGLAGGTFGGDDSISQELKTQAGISDDVFSDGAANKSASKGMGQSLSQKGASQYSAPKSMGTAGKNTAGQKTSDAAKQFQQSGMGQSGASSGMGMGAMGMGMGMGMGNMGMGGESILMTEPQPCSKNSNTSRQCRCLQSSILRCTATVAGLWHRQSSWR